MICTRGTRSVFGRVLVNNKVFCATLPGNSARSWGLCRGQSWPHSTRRVDVRETPVKITSSNSEIRRRPMPPAGLLSRSLHPINQSGDHALGDPDLEVAQFRGLSAPRLGKRFVG